MKKHKTELIILLLISIGGGILFPNYLKTNPEMEFPGISDFLIWTAIIFVFWTFTYFAVKPGLDNETKKNMKPLPDGYHELYDQKDQVTKKGFFIGGKLRDGSRYVYKKDGELSHKEIYKDGIYIGDTSMDRSDLRP